MELNAKIYVAGHNGLVGSAITRALKDAGYNNLILKSSKDLDLREQGLTSEFFEREKPEYVFLAAAKVGGIVANSTYPAQFIRENLLIECNVIDAAWRNGCKKLLFLGSSCIYPKFSPQPIPEEALLSGPLEETNDAYALAKISGIRMASAYRQQYGFDAISVMPPNLYGPGDNFHINNSHVIPALIRRFHEAASEKAPEISIWGSGTPLREFLHVDDLARACLFLMDKYSSDSHINVGSGKEISIMNLAKMIADITGYKGNIATDSSKPDGTPRKLLNNSKILNLGWRPHISLREGLESTYQWFLRQNSSVDGIRV